MTRMNRRLREHIDELEEAGWEVVEFDRVHPNSPPYQELSVKLSRPSDD